MADMPHPAPRHATFEHNYDPPSPPLADSPSKTPAKKKRKPQAKKKEKRTVEYIKVPKHWFADPLHHIMKTIVRPPTARTRRKEQEIKIRVPEQIFLELMKPLNDNCMEAFEWVDEEKSALRPTRCGGTLTEYKYTCKNPEVLDSLWRLQDWEKAPVGKKTGKKTGKERSTRRGHGCARLHLSAAAEERGERTDLLAQVSGNTTITFKVPHEERVMPTLTMTTKVSTMDKNGHIIWPTTFGNATKAALRKQMRYHLKEMIDNPEYPTLTGMLPSLTTASESVRPPAEPLLLRGPRPPSVSQNV